MRVLRGTLYVKVVLLLCFVMSAGFLYLRLAAGPLSFGRLPEGVTAALAHRIGPGWTVAVRNSALELRDGSIALRAVGLEIRNPDGASVLRSPDAIVSLDTVSLLMANLHPRAIEFRDLQLRALVNRDGSLSFVPGPDLPEDAPSAVASGTDQAVPGSAEPPSPAAPDRPSPVSVAAQSLFELILGSSGVIGALDEAQITNARLLLVDADQKERATFRRLDATFERTESGGRRFEARLDGPRGVWQLNGSAAPESPEDLQATLVAAEAPVQDMLLLSGLSSLPAPTDLKLSGRVDARLTAGRLTNLEVQLSGEGSAETRGASGGIETAAVEAAWDEARRALAIRSIRLGGPETRIHLQGELTLPADEPGWRLGLTGRDAVLAGIAPSDPPVKLDEVELRLAGQDGLLVDKLALRGPSLAVDVTGAYGTAVDPRSVHFDIRASGTAARSVLRLWPEQVTPETRSFLVENLQGGLVESLAVSVALTGTELARAQAEEPIPDSALQVDFSIRDGRMRVAEGLPPLSRATVTGTVTGTKARILAPSAGAQMEDGRALALRDGSFVIDSFRKGATVARIQFRADGGADALGSFLRAPVMQEIAALDLDPATMKGRVEARAQLDLPLKRIESLADLPLTITGKVSDLAVDKVFGSERLEGGQLSFAYDRGSLAIKGDTKLGGIPATLDVRQPQEGSGEAVLAFVLDDAARTRRGLASAPQLSGPVPVRVLLPLGRGAGTGYRLEADLTKATVDQVVPGWTKAAGRPGKLAFSFAALEGSGAELRDLTLESGPVLVRGTATISGDGQLERAEFPTFKFSPGDEMRAVIERAGSTFKVTVRGSVGDARPWTRGLGAPAKPSTRGSRAANAKQAHDFDLDLALNILSGHNDQALTNAVIKSSVRDDQLRHLQVSGRLGPAAVSAQTVQRDRAPAVIVFQSEDAGATLRFFDVYRRMIGGGLVLQLTTAEGPQLGTLTISEFLLRNEPALRRIIPTQSQIVTAEDRTGSVQAYRVDVNEVEFTRARVDFTRTAGRIEFRNAAIWGNQVGFTLNGAIDYARDRADIAGTFVPAYGVNNVFAQVPLFGPLLGGGQHEGLFAVNFRVSGPASAPILTVNPLSAVAPGFLRKLFGAIGVPSPDDPVPPRSVDR